MLPVTITVVVIVLPDLFSGRFLARCYGILTARSTGVAQPICRCYENQKASRNSFLRKAFNVGATRHQLNFSLPVARKSLLQAWS
jgi:hypothetical protein